MMSSTLPGKKSNRLTSRDKWIPFYRAIIDHFTIECPPERRGVQGEKKYHLRSEETMADAPENEVSCGKACQKVEVPSEDELRALNAMREIKEKVRGLKKRISRVCTSPGGKDDEIQHLESEVEQLKKEWQEWEEKRKLAARQRMILLGHENPD
jgi:predicted RNase H-like nuclease (RuvC/YqgF family)